MTRRPTLALAAGALLLAGALSACGGGDDSADAASTPSAGTSSSAEASPSAGGSASGSAKATSADAQKFCDAYATIVKSGADDLAAQKKAIAALAKVGTPQSMDADAKSGYDLMVKAISDSKTSAELDKLGKSLSQADTLKLFAFSQYLTTTCADQLGVATASPSAN